MSTAVVTRPAPSLPKARNSAPEVAVRQRGLKQADEALTEGRQWGSGTALHRQRAFQGGRVVVSLSGLALWNPTGLLLSLASPKACHCLLGVAGHATGPTGYGRRRGSRQAYSSGTETLAGCRRHGTSSTLAGFAVLLKWNKDPRRDSRQRGGSETRTACQTRQKVEQAWHLVHWGVASE